MEVRKPTTRRVPPLFSSIKSLPTVVLHTACSRSSVSGLLPGLPRPPHTREHAVVSFSTSPLLGLLLYADDLAVALPDNRRRRADAEKGRQECSSLPESGSISVPAPTSAAGCALSAAAGCTLSATAGLRKIWCRRHRTASAVPNLRRRQRSLWIRWLEADLVPPPLNHIVATSLERAAGRHLIAVQGSWVH
ncbi:hypothetical protein E2562_015437 [Oryza meyeriana var. granulata]|uniref:Uncharacterized protein n=1 Tax=Oryza meyeriana var. granulata TaxID=110450 RepID=A0A6G1BW67_9ORYZ|nr:hypothetical protein E2562_015437 [Oryza meyeriana var. granulata]